MNLKSFLVLAGFAAACSFETACGNKLKEEQAPQGATGGVSGYSTAQSGVTASSLGFSSNQQDVWNACRYPASGDIVSCSEYKNAVDSSACQSYEAFAPSCPSAGVVAICNVSDSSGLIRKDYKYTGTLQDAQLYTSAGPGQEISCNAP